MSRPSDGQTARKKQRDGLVVILVTAAIVLGAGLTFDRGLFCMMLGAAIMTTRTVVLDVWPGSATRSLRLITLLVPPLLWVVGAVITFA